MRRPKSPVRHQMKKKYQYVEQEKPASAVDSSLVLGLFWEAKELQITMTRALIETLKPKKLMPESKQKKRYAFQDDSMEVQKQFVKMIFKHLLH